MKRGLVPVLLVVVAVGAIAAGAWLAPALLGNPGYVLIEFGDWRVQMSVLVLAGGVLAVWLAASLLVALVRMPRRALRRLRAAQDRRNLDRGLLALSEGNWATAERSLARAMRGREAGTAGYLAAARAAQGRSAPGRRDEYLALADRKFGRRHFVTALARARLQVGEGDYDGAIGLLEQLHLKKPRHDGVLKLLLQCYQQADRWHEVRVLVPAIRRAGIVSSDRAGELAALAASRELAEARDVADLERIHASFERELRRNPEVVCAYAGRALELDRAELAEPGLRRAIDRAVDGSTERAAEESYLEKLLDLYAQADPGDVGARIRQCEQWLARKPDLAALHLALGRLHLAGRNDEKAREHLQKAVRGSGNPAAYAALGQVLDRAGQLESATQCYRNALRLEQGRAPDPLPLPPSASGSGPA
ncbi:MAG: heme biosynthesis HemY N-terminal domain-containing protein [Wenzhouxiangellaceae bacterium]|nr:heme biosynthesis HemY N-terminal domain-containing protein [Wenzhouxiangellaceae bacterium]